MKIVKFGGKSLANGKGIAQVISIIEDKISNKEKITVVVSARGNSTDELEEILEKASKNIAYKEQLDAFKKYQNEVTNLDFNDEFSRLENLFEGVNLLQDYSSKIKDEVLAHGEVISAKTIADILSKKGIKANAIDTRNLIKTDGNFGSAQPILDISEKNVSDYFKTINDNEINIVTGFIASNINGDTTTLGRNGSNYSASLLANFLNATELQNFTHVNGIYTANPDLVSEAKKLKELSYNEANELANLGTTILHAKTILPLVEKNINLRILNTFKPHEEGTLITSKTKNDGIKSLSVLDKVSLINIEGKGFLGKSGIDARIFGALGKKNISVSIISQGSSERGIGIVVDTENAEKAKDAIESEFENDILTKDLDKVTINKNIAVISMVGLHLSQFHHPYNALIKNQITPLLFNNAVTGKNVSLVVEKQHLNKAINVIHGQIFGAAKNINIAIFGVGLVGGNLIQQIIQNAQGILKKRKIQLNVFAIASSKKLLLQQENITESWKDNLDKNGIKEYSINHVIEFAKKHHLENLIAVDNTANKNFISNYEILADNGFDLVSSNKIANTLSYDFYKKLRSKLDKNKKTYLYETNVGAGLPLIDTIRLLHESGENITKIKGVFSGSLSYLFNTFSSDNIPFSKVLQQAIDSGFTEPDPREDLSGNDVARKLLILARELDLENEFSDVQIENLIPEELREKSTEYFLENLQDLDKTYNEIKNNLKENQVLRYVGELSGDLFQSKGELTVKLVAIASDSTLGSLKGSDVIFEIYTDSYGEKPIVIQGAGAGGKVTARGVFGDILRIANK